MTNVTLAQVRAMSDEQLIALHDELGKTVVFMPADCLDELNRRAQSAEAKAMRRYTLWITLMTAIMSIATLVNLGVAFLLLRR